MAITVDDDGTMDTVLVCDKCGQEYRFTYEPGPDNPGGSEDYKAFVNASIEEVEAEHECAPSDQ